jgi:hypothetical protein
MIIDGSTGLEFPDGSDQTSAFTGNAASLTSGTINVARLPSSGINAASITVGTLPTAQLPSSGVNAASITTGVLLQANGGTGTTVGYNGFKNRIINGDMIIDQRNAGASVTANDGTYSVDRWKCVATVNGRFSMQQNAGSVTPPAGFTNYLGCTSTAATSVASGDFFQLRQVIEGFNFADFSFGTANAQPLTLSFWVRSSLTGAHGGSVFNAAGSRTYPFSFTISAANTWEFKTVTISGDTTGTWVGATNGGGLQVGFNLGTGSSLSGTAGAWSGSTFMAPTGAVKVVATNGATFYVTGVQLEKGSTATSFDVLPYGTEFLLCQRYYTKTYLDAVAPGSTASPAQANAIWSSVPTTNSYPQIGQWFYPVTMRAVPTLVIYNPNTGAVNGFRGDGDNYSPASPNSVGNKCVTFYGNNVSVGTSVFISVQATANAEL